MWHGGGRARTRGPRGSGPVPASELELSPAAQKAVALAQQEKSTWTRADLIKYLGRVLPRTGRDPAAAAALLEDLADRALRSEFEPVACLEAPEPAEVPRSLLRADGRSIYQRHGGVRYATHAQLSIEERMLALARGRGAPRMTRAEAARALGADLARLEAALAGRAPGARGAQDAPGPRTRTGLREDQAAAALAVLTDGRRVSVINAPAGSGKTWVLAAAGRAWAAAGLGRVIGITPSQSARNTLAAGVPVSYNAAQFLGHLPGRRGARGPVQLRPGDLVLIDEASMVSTPDLADVIAQAAAAGAKVILAGDTQQLQAVENGGGMSLLADALGYARLTEPVRFRAAWEQAASLRLRDGDTSVLAEYDQHGRIRGGDTRADDGRRRGRLPRADPGRHRHAADGRGPRAAPRAEPPHPRRPHHPRHRLRRPRGDDRRRHPGQRRGPDHLHPQRPRASRRASPAGPWPTATCSASRPSPTTGCSSAAPWTPTRAPGSAAGPTDTSCSTFYRDAELGYAVTDHAAQSRTVTAGLAVITGTEDRQHAYVALTRGTDINLAYVFTASPRTADPAPGPRPAPELARYDRRAAGPAARPPPPPRRPRRR